MANIFKRLYREHNPQFWTPARRRSLYLSFVLIVLAIVVQVAAGRYSAAQARLAPPESDLFLNNLPIVDLGFLLVGGAILFWIFSLWLFSLRPRYLPLGIKALALLIIFRAFFMNLTREGIYPGGFVPTSENYGFSLYHLVTFQGNLFFSGHTAFPFLMALIFWNERFWRRFFLAATVFFGAAVLLAHVHYSIDVFAAPFIVYGIFRIAEKLFPRDARDAAALAPVS